MKPFISRRISNRPSERKKLLTFIGRISKKKFPSLIRSRIVNKPPRYNEETKRRRRRRRRRYNIKGNGAVHRIRKSLALKRTYIIVHQFI